MERVIITCVTFQGAFRDSFRVGGLHEDRIGCRCCRRYCCSRGKGGFLRHFFRPRVYDRDLMRSNLLLEEFLIRLIVEVETLKMENMSCSLITIQ